MAVEDDYMDVLQNIEFAIVGAYRQDRSTVDTDARDAVNLLTRQYEAEIEGRGAPNAPLSSRAQTILTEAKAMCEWRLGRSPGPDGSDPGSNLTPEELILCLKRIRKSIEFWSKEGGRQGYLKFVSQYVL